VQSHLNAFQYAIKYPILVECLSPWIAMIPHSMMKRLISMTVIDANDDNKTLVYIKECEKRERLVDT